MADRYIKVEGKTGLVRDRHSGAIININSDQISQARSRKKRLREEKQELETLKNDVSEIKIMLKQILEAKNGSN